MGNSCGGLYYGVQITKQDYEYLHKAFREAYANRYKITVKEVGDHWYKRWKTGAKDGPDHFHGSWDGITAGIFEDDYLLYIKESVVATDNGVWYIGELKKTGERWKEILENFMVAFNIKPYIPANDMMYGEADRSKRSKELSLIGWYMTGYYS